MTTISKSTFTFTVLHCTDEPPADLRHAMSEAWDGHMVGLDSEPSTVAIPDDQVATELVALGNDGAFFDMDLGRESG